MRIGIDARFYGPAGKGLGRYTEELVRGVTQLDSKNEYVIFLHPSSAKLFDVRKPNVQAVLAPFRWYSLAEQLRFPALIARQRLDLVHFTHFNVPLFTAAPFVVTIHDLILSRFPTERASSLGPMRYALKHRVYQLVIRRAVQQARHVLTVSETTKRDIVQEFGVDPARVTVTLLGVDPQRWQQPAPSDAVARWGIDRPFLLYVGNAYPHKNLDRLIAAMRLLRSHGHDWQLVLVGREDYFFRRLKQEAGHLGLLTDQTIVFPGYLTDAELARLFRDCLGFVFPSLAEGFGLPPLEAMAAGAVVASSSVSSMPEILGGAVLYFDPHSVTDMAATIERLGTDNELRAELQRRARDRVLRYTWETMTQRTLNVYRQCLPA